MTGPRTKTLSAEEIATLRHDLRTPINHIVGYCELLLDDSEGPAHATRRMQLEGSLRAVHEALDMINTSLSDTATSLTQRDVDDLYERLREPRSRIMESMTALLTPGELVDDDEFTSDVRKIRHATEQLAATHRSGILSPATVSQARRRQDSADLVSEASPAKHAPSGSRGTILVVDDETNNRNVLERHLKRHSYEVVCASNGEAALRSVHETSYDVVLLDVRMPGMDGYDVLRHMKQNQETRDIPVVMISAADDLSTIAACIEAGADDFLPKPFDPVILHARVGASVEKKRLRDQEVDYLRQVERVADAATAVERGTYETGSLTAVAARTDALGRLARVFDSMAIGVKERERRLQDHVDTLRREMREAKQTVADAGNAQAADGRLQDNVETLRNELHEAKQGVDELDGEHDVDDGSLIPGELFANRYHIMRVIGRGGMGTVYKARDRELAEDIAIKTLRSSAMSLDPTVVERFKTEIRLARRISHRNVVRTHDLGENNGAYYVTMEYVEGITVRELIDMRGHLSVPATLGIAQQLASSLTVAHEQGVIHRDIKPQNMLLDADGVLKVMDFGIARLAQNTNTITQAGMVVGTPAYMAPEQLLAEEVDARSDLYAMGVVLYECLTGSLPFSGVSPIALIAKVLHTLPIPPADRSADIPAPLSDLVMHLLDKEPAARPSSARQLRELLSELQ